jgi:hypothetical protein
LEYSFPVRSFGQTPHPKSHPKSHPNVLLTSSHQRHHPEGEHTMVDGQENSFPFGFWLHLV